MILLKENATAAQDNAVYINKQMEPGNELAAVTLTRYSIAFTNTSAVTGYEIGGITYTITSTSIATEAGCLALANLIAAKLQELGYGWDGEYPISWDIVTTVTTIETGYSQIVFDQINATAFVAGATTPWGLA